MIINIGEFDKCKCLGYKKNASIKTVTPGSILKVSFPLIKIYSVAGFAAAELTF